MDCFYGNTSCTSILRTNPQLVTYLTIFETIVENICSISLWFDNFGANIACLESTKMRKKSKLSQLVNFFRDLWIRWQNWACEEDTFSFPLWKMVVKLTWIDENIIYFLFLTILRGSRLLAQTCFQFLKRIFKTPSIRFVSMLAVHRFDSAVVNVQYQACGYLW